LNADASITAVLRVLVFASSGRREGYAKIACRAVGDNT